jgi:RNA polymerase sigma-70 factor (ECF subfamily)
MTGHSERIGLGVTTFAGEDSFARCEERFAALVNRQARFVFRVAYAVLRNAHDAEDVVQEVFLKLYRSRAWEKIEEERAYLSRVTWRMAVDHLPRAAGGRLALNAESPSRAETPEQAALQGQLGGGRT